MSVLATDQVRRFYDRRAGSYDLLTIGFRALGFGRHQARLIAGLELSPGDIVVDLCCGTGVNLERLSAAVGEAGRVVAVDLSEGMLGEARKRAGRAGLGNVDFVQADVCEFDFPASTRPVLSTFGLEMVPSYEEVVARTYATLPAGGRLGLLGLKRPEGWPDWLIEAGVALTAPFGVSRDYEDFRPWVAADARFERVAYREHLAGAAYSYVSRSGTSGQALLF
ncbi:methlytransferase, UbiE/COQ5 family protein [Parvularcula bermudensis HTCC2503]|uniref:Methlytransferase, UbiE/COQ5 family protein n=1 Tax=Parvularcula bermudensis (strain ATCC BAA-594 / HTCC2503 / KCTC 12087) TaxID=314260 RepID=E0TIJ8_PARBH|nr:methyltransferase domain-containing protein [Parvularcula bermudensis]ADM10856.1 methlytransferase, UbiE/COQ5 family protein [Parvularcula bermudensis HTCC2503]